MAVVAERQQFARLGRHRGFAAKRLHGRQREDRRGGAAPFGRNLGHARLVIGGGVDVGDAAVRIQAEGERGREPVGGQGVGAVRHRRMAVAGDADGGWHTASHRGLDPEVAVPIGLNPIIGQVVEVDVLAGPFIEIEKAGDHVVGGAGAVGEGAVADHAREVPDGACVARVAECRCVSGAAFSAEREGEERAGRPAVARWQRVDGLERDLSIRRWLKCGEGGHAAR